MDIYSKYTTQFGLDCRRLSLRLSMIFLSSWLELWPVGVVYIGYPLESRYLNPTQHFAYSPDRFGVVSEVTVRYRCHIDQMLESPNMSNVPPDMPCEIAFGGFPQSIVLHCSSGVPSDMSGAFFPTWQIHEEWRVWHNRIRYPSNRREERRCYKRGSQENLIFECPHTDEEKK